MNQLDIHGKTGRSTILVGERIENVVKFIPDTKIVSITDKNVLGFYEGRFPSCEKIVIGTGEGIKTIDTVSRIYEELIALEADRSSFLLGIGGGIVCDIAGFAASTYLRGIRFGFVATTLLSQVDASVGGKNGVNFQGYKNMVGVFSQPEFVICDTNLLKTLPERELACGFAEIVKHAVIADADYFAFLEQNYEKALSLDADVIDKIVYDSVAIKASVVNQDEQEKGERRKLNFGHTFGHALEKTTGVLHGEAVSIGMTVAVILSEKKGLLSYKDAQRIIALLKNLNLPTRMIFDRELVLEAIKKDKKRERDDIHFVLLAGIGKAVIAKISVNELKKVIIDGNYC